MPPPTITDFINGSFVKPQNPEETIAIRSPADIDDIIGELAWHRDQVDAAILAARHAFKSWRALEMSSRVSLLKKYQAALKTHADDIAHAISREIGKPTWEARTEAAAMVSKVDVTINEGLTFTRDVAIDDLPGEIQHRPHGVAAVIGPFNFPGHLPNGQIVPALLSGNTVVFKPSEKGALTAQLMARCFDEAGFPPGVFNLVNGSAPVAERLSAHSGINALLFTGSLDVGRKILSTNVHRPGLMIALELGGKNASIVLDDCDLERTAREIAFSGFATAGQRCTATSRVIATHHVAERLGERLAAIARRTTVGHPQDANVFMGPLISESSRQAVLKATDAARQHGFTVLAPSMAFEARTKGYYLSPSVHHAPSPVAHVAGYTDVELFGPDLSIFAVDSIDEAIAIANNTPYGLSTAVFTKSRANFDRIEHELEVGVIHWNKSSAGASGRVPFGGVKSSGNHRPAGILMGQSCVYPVGVLLAPSGPDSALPSWPGIDFT